jgi:hypothetical protein
MSGSVPVNSVSWRVILLRRNASEFLVFETGSGLFLPIVEIPAHSRTAQALNAEIKVLWHLAVYSLYSLELIDTCPMIRYHVVETLQHDARAPQSARWVSAGDASRLRFAESSDFAAVQMWSERLTRKEANTSHLPFDKPGWFFAVKDFVQDSIQNIPLRLTGQFLQSNASPSFSLIRFETDGDAIWFKAVGEPNTCEFSLTVFVSSKLPAFSPRVLATQPLWNGWVMLEIAGKPLAQTENLSAWCNAARDLARMQIASIEMIDGILQNEPRDVRTTALLGQVQPFFALMREWMDRQTKTTPARLSLSEIEQLESDTRDALLALQHVRIPDTLGHLDLNPENVMTVNGGTVFLDWAEGCIGHPFLSFAHVLEYFLRTFGNNAPEKSTLIHAYLDVWEPLRLTEAPQTTLSTSLFLAIFAHAVSTDLWRDSRRMLEPATAGYYRSLARRMKRYRDQVRDGVSIVSEMFV